nr:hypothetical protein [Halomonas sp. UBA3074]
MLRFEFLLTFTLLVVSTTVAAASLSWSEGYGMGVVEYSVTDSTNNQLAIACPIEDGYVSALVKIDGEYFSSEDLPGFDVVVDGELYQNPFYTDCRVCGDIFRSFWPKFREAGEINVVLGNASHRFTVKNLDNTLPELNEPDNPCRSSW